MRKLVRLFKTKLTVTRKNIANVANYEHTGAKDSELSNLELHYFVI